MKSIRITSLQGATNDQHVRALCSYVGTRLQHPTKFVDVEPWQKREQALYAGTVQVGWICGFPYVLQADQPHPPLELLAAPVMAAARYENRPIYFSDVVVHRESRYRRFGDLRGASWAYNEPRSQSGYNVTRWHLAQLGEQDGFLGRVVQAGAHTASLQMVLDGAVDASAIDSTVLENELTLRPSIEGQIRVVETLGPSPIPPWVVRRDLPPDLRVRLRNILVTMHLDLAGRRLLEEARMKRFQAVSDDCYDVIRVMSSIAQRVTL